MPCPKKKYDCESILLYLIFFIMPRLLLFCVFIQFYILYLNSASSVSNPKVQIDIKKKSNSSFRGETKNIELLHDVKTCNLNPSLINEIKNYESIANKIIAEATKNNFKGRTYKELASFINKFSHRMSGSKNLEDSIDYMLKKMTNDGLENVHGEEALVAHWVRGEEKAELLTPIQKNIPLLGLGNTVGTPPEGITGEVWVVRSIAELRADPDRAKGKIIVYSQVYTSYGKTVIYRIKGASEAARVGGIAALIKSIAPISLNIPHTGAQNYDSDVVHIPAACITNDDAEHLYSLQESGENVTIHLKMLDNNLPFATSRNAIGELKGHTYPEEVVIVSGHIDSWDVGEGAMDDGGGCFISTEALVLLKQLNLIPKRTLRAIMWTSEEVGLWGSKSYVQRHKNEMKNIIAAFESDSGTFTPKGLDFAGSEEAGCIVNEILKLLTPLNATEYTMYDSVSTDIGPLISQGVPGLSLRNDADEYFWYHHTEADKISIIDSEQLDEGTAVWAVAAYVIADLSISLPRKRIVPSNKI